MSLALEEYVTKLQSAGVDLIVVMDPNEGTEGAEKKSHELDQRFRQRCDSIGRIMQTLHTVNKSNVNSAAHIKSVGADWQLPPLSSGQAMRTLRKLGVRVITCEEEADVEIVQCLARTPGAYAIIGNDSDFFLMRGVRFIPLQYLTFSHDGRLLARVFTPESVASALGLPESRLHELAAICGNDITSEFIDRHTVASVLGIPTIRSKTRGNRCHPTDAAAFLQRIPADTRLADDPRLATILQADSAFADALRRNEHFYSSLPSRLHSAAPPAGSELTRLLSEGLRACRLPAWVLAVHLHRLHFCGPKVETMSPSESMVDTSLAPLRRVTYALVAPPSPRSALAGRGAVITEHVREGHGRRPLALETVPLSALREATGCDSLVGLRALALPRRCAALPALLRLSADPTTPAAVADSDPLAAGLVVAAAGRGGTAAARAGVALILHALLLLRGGRRRGGDRAEADVLCLATTALLLCCCADSDDRGGDGGGLLALPEIVPSAETVETASLYLAVVGSVASLAQLLDLERVIPDPAQLFSGRLFAHLRARTEPARALLARHAAALVRLDPQGLLREASPAPTEAEGPADTPPPGSSESSSSEDDSDGEAVAAAEAAMAAAGYAERLPIMDHREAIVAAVAARAVTCIQGETGCGKSSMVPQFLVQAARARGEPVRVVVTQPRRIAAITLARRVAEQLGSQPLGRVVGYRVGHGDRLDSPRCAVRFVTAGYLLQHLSHRPEHLARYTHVVLDEVHERSMDMDMLLLLLRTLTGPEGPGNRTKLVVMSATLQAGLFGDYFATPECPAADAIFVGARRFPVRTVFLDGLLECYTALRGPAGSAVSKLLGAFRAAAAPKLADGDGKFEARMRAQVSAQAAPNPLLS